MVETRGPKAIRAKRPDSSNQNLGKKQSCSIVRRYAGPGQMSRDHNHPSVHPAAGSNVGTSPIKDFLTALIRDSPSSDINIGHKWRQASGLRFIRQQHRYRHRSRRRGSPVIDDNRLHHYYGTPQEEGHRTLGSQGERRQREGVGSGWFEGVDWEFPIRAERT
ncbi:hypothetical protein BDP81DRAFT_455682 [Colletotrichum phormii]|uniref:Uncharacterized protein n=1 Tax=Colletotrichum phormii TaxID=359342 RepID=A0AAJ0E816_9PEZI|nr:uncharacterized protein BDP81DRAFT_455682 [Colletotrichum phormii]KAK1622126.1 hypothetical protein BDP81DRAFT_455682 [Colletotrichum phormii]